MWEASKSMEHTNYFVYLDSQYREFKRTPRRGPRDARRNPVTGVNRTPIGRPEQNPERYPVSRPESRTESHAQLPSDRGPLKENRITVGQSTNSGGSHDLGTLDQRLTEAFNQRPSNDQPQRVGNPSTPQAAYAPQQIGHASQPANVRHRAEASPNVPNGDQTTVSSARRAIQTSQQVVQPPQQANNNRPVIEVSSQPRGLNIRQSTEASPEFPIQDHHAISTTQRATHPPQQVFPPSQQTDDSTQLAHAYSQPLGGSSIFQRPSDSPKISSGNLPAESASTRVEGFTLTSKKSRFGKKTHTATKTASETNSAQPSTSPATSISEVTTSDNSNNATLPSPTWSFSNAPTRGSGTSVRGASTMADRVRKPSGRGRGFAR
ncbi:hypothetical protein BT63DRAFT_58071 [Microthyrium microscopicum]|uniref:Uncharacterized protein n=1 Tax=Microthyrium microscopicum TaxID=703497 RepID=A0A6A6U5J8_9PEZI|nr:hypothetical protein BT63DRAFT_58071 [Microthyrium microscopicum]